MNPRDLSHEELVKRLMRSVLYSGLDSAVASELLELKEEALHRMRAVDRVEQVSLRMIREAPASGPEREWCYDTAREFLVAAMAD